MNRRWDDPRHRETVMAIETEGQIYEFLEDDLSDVNYFFQPAFLGQKNDELIFAFYWEPRNSAEPLNTGLAIVSRPLSEKRVRFAQKDDTEDWQEMIAYVKGLDLDPAGAERLCRWYNRLSIEVFGIDCQS